MKRLLREIWDALRSPMILFTLIVGIVLILILLVLDMASNTTFEDVLVEAHGLIFDIFLFGVLLTGYELVLRKREETLRSRERREDLIKRYLEEIDDYRGWKSETALYRNVGNIKRLNGLDVTAVNLSRCFLAKAQLQGINLRGATLSEARLAEADLRSANFHQAQLDHAMLNSANLYESNLQEVRMEYATLVSSNLQQANLSRATMSHARLANADLSGASLNKARCKESDFSYARFVNANLKEVDFQSATLGGADFRGAQLDGVRFDQADLGEAIFSPEAKEMVLKSGGLDLEEVIFRK